MPRQLRVFLCHASQDKPAVWKLHRYLTQNGISPWLDQADLLPGQNWEVEIPKALFASDVILVCLSKNSVNKEGYVQKEIVFALDKAMEKPEETIFVIPVKLEECEVPKRLSKYQWVNFFDSNDSKRLMGSLRIRASELQIEINDNQIENNTKTRKKSKSKPRKKNSVITRYALPWIPDISKIDLRLYQFIEIPPSEKTPYLFYISKYPVTNGQFARFLNAPDYANPIYWLEFPKFNHNCKRIGNWSNKGLDWLHNQLREINSNILYPNYWNDEKFGLSKINNPVVGISWYEANAYCNWLLENWGILSEGVANLNLQPRVIRLPIDNEWEVAAGGVEPNGRYPWDVTGKATTSLKEIVRRANVRERGVGCTTPVDYSPNGESVFGVADMAGNVWEWQANFSDKNKKYLSQRGGSWLDELSAAHTSFRYYNYPKCRYEFRGFRVMLLPYN